MYYLTDSNRFWKPADLHQFITVIRAVN